MSVKILWRANSKPQERFLLSEEFEVLYGGAKGGGKEQPMYAKVLTNFGWREIGNCRVGMDIVDPVSGGTSKIIGVYPQGEREIYELKFDDGAKTRVGMEHLWFYKLPRRKRPFTKDSIQRAYVKEFLDYDCYPTSRFQFYRVGTTRTLIDNLEKGLNPRIPLSSPVLYQVNGRTGHGVVSPYFIGLFLGDGCNTNLRFTSYDEEIKKYVSGFDMISSDGVNFRFKAGSKTRKFFDQWLRNNNLRHCLSDTKFIPDYVFTAPIDYRVDILAGLLDTDGYVDNRGHIEFTSTSFDLVSGVQELVRGLGGKATVSEPMRGSYKDKNGVVVECKQYWRLYIWLPFASKIFKLTRKAERCVDAWNGNYENMRKLVDVSRVGKDEAICIKVSSPFGLYITDDYIVTHNTDALVMKMLTPEYINNPRYRGLLLRRTYPRLQEILDRTNFYYRKLIPGSIYKKELKRWEFPNGAIVKLGHCEHENDKYNYWGHEYHIIGIDQVEEFTQSQYEIIRMCARSTVEGLKPIIRCTCNPTNNWVKAYWYDVSPNGEVYTDVLPDGSTITRQFIKATVFDNKTLLEKDPQYLALLKSIENEALRKRFLEGDWNTFEGKAFDEFNPDVHVKTLTELFGKSTPPQGSTVFISMDWGYSKPFSVHWHTITYYDKIITFREWYGIQFDEYKRSFKPNKGLRLKAHEVAKGILDRSKDLQPEFIVCDPSIWNKVGHQMGSIGQEMELIFANAGIPMLRGNNNRVDGKMQVHNRLSMAPDGQPWWLIASNCQHLIRTLPLLSIDQKNPDDIDSSGEDHAYDDIRYAFMQYPLEVESSIAEMENRKRELDEYRRNTYNWHLLNMPDVMTYH